MHFNDERISQYRRHSFTSAGDEVFNRFDMPLKESAVNASGRFGTKPKERLRREAIRSTADLCRQALAGNYGPFRTLASLEVERSLDISATHCARENIDLEITSRRLQLPSRRQ